jgi:uncharacterized hydrophobic protein (TIGR00271 family)
VLHLRVITDPAHVDALVTHLDDCVGVVNVVVAGDATRDGCRLVSLDVAVETAGHLIEEIEQRGWSDGGSILAHRLEVAAGAKVDQAVADAPGHSSEGVVWHQVIDQAKDDATGSLSFYAMLSLAVLIAAVGILTDSAILIVGAMVVGPDFGPLSALIVGLAKRRRDLTMLGLRTLAIAAPVCVVLTVVAVLLLRGADQIPDAFLADVRPNTRFIVKPDVFSAIVALAAGIAGALSLIESKAGVLVGVLISVTTVPAVAAAGVALALGDWEDLGGAVVQLAINAVCLLIAGVATIVAHSRVVRLVDERSAKVGA